MNTQDLTMKQILSVLFGFATIYFLCKYAGVSSDLAIFIFAPINLFIMFFANVYALIDNTYAKFSVKNNGKITNLNCLNEALGVGTKGNILNYGVKDILISIFFFVCPMISLWMFGRIVVAAYYDIILLIEKHTIHKYVHWKTKQKI